MFNKKSKNIIKYILSLIIISIVLLDNFTLYARSHKTEEDKIKNKIEVLYLLRIIDDKDNLDKNITRAEFAKMIIKSTDKKDSAAFSIESVANDVGYENIYAGYIKEAVNGAYMYRYVDGSFKPNEYITYSDLARAALTMLGYTNDDFRGNQVLGRNLKFKSLELGKDIDKEATEVLTKMDVINGIYDTLKENIKDTSTAYGLKIFDKLIKDEDGELNADELIEKKVEGPFIIKNVDDISVPFEVTKYNVYLNGLLSDMDTVKYDIGNYGYAIFYLDLNNKMVYCYTEREDIKAPIRVLKGYVQGIYYSAKDMTTPYRVDIDLHKYTIESEEMRFAFSSVGKFKENDYVVYLCNKMNDVTSAYLDENGHRVVKNDEAEPYNGSIINAFSYDLFK